MKKNMNMILQKSTKKYYILLLLFGMIFSFLFPLQGQEKGTAKEIWKWIDESGSLELSPKMEAQRNLINHAPQAIPVLEEILSGANPRQKHLCPSAIQTMAAFFWDGKANKILSLGEEQYKGEFSYKIQVHPELYKAVIEALGKLQYLPAQKFLLQVVKTSKLPDMQRQALRALEELNSPSAPEIQKELLAHFFTLSRHSFFQEEVGRFLERQKIQVPWILQNLPPEKACLLLGTYQSEESLDALHSLGKKHPSSSGSALIEIGKRKGIKYLSFLQDSLSSEDIELQKAALYGLSMVPDRRNFGPLRRYAFLIGKRGEREMAPLFIPLLKKEDKIMTDYFLSCLSQEDMFLQSTALKALEILDVSALSAIVEPYMYSSSPIISIEAAGIFARKKKKGKRLEELLKKFSSQPLLCSKTAYEMATAGMAEGRDKLFELAFSSQNLFSQAMEYLISLKSPEVSQKAMEIYQKGGNKRARAFRILQGCLNKEYVPFLVKALEDPSPWVRYMALDYLSQMDGLELSKEILSRIWKESRNPYTMIPAQKIFFKGKEKFFPYIPQSISSSDSAEIQAGLNFLYHLDSTCIVSLAKRILYLSYHPDAGVREASAWLISRIPGRTCEIRLGEMMEDSHFFVRLGALKSLSNQRPSFAVPQWIKALRDSNLGVRMEAHRRLLYYQSSGFSYHPSLPLKEREVSIQKWYQWATAGGWIK